MPTDDPWKVPEPDFPDSGEGGEKLRFMLNYAVLAQSGHNTQPWPFRVEDNEVDIYSDMTLEMAYPLRVLAEKIRPESRMSSKAGKSG